VANSFSVTLPSRPRAATLKTICPKKLYLACICCVYVRRRL